MLTDLFPFQIEAIQEMHRLGGRVLLAHEQGLGKTCIFLNWLKQMPNARPALVVCPAGLKTHWRRQAKEHTDMDLTILSGMSPSGLGVLRKKDLFVVNYEILTAWLDFLRSMKFQAIAGDEIHFISNLRSQRSRAFRVLCSGVPHVIGISGTPLLNAPFELFPILNVLRPKEFASPHAFGMEFCQASRDFGRWEYRGARNLSRLHAKLLHSCLVRKTKEEVMPELPPKRQHVQILEIEDRKEYERAEEDVVSWLAQNDLAAAQRAARAERFTRFTHLKALVAKLKMPFVIKWLESYFRESDGKILVGTVHKATVASLFQRFGKFSVVIDGSKTAKQKDAAEDSFRKDSKVRMLIGNMTACGVGRNMPEASAVALTEIPWTPGCTNQFIDRVHRMNSTHSVDAYFLIADNTIEEYLCQIIQRKQNTLDQTLDGVLSRADSLTIADELQKVLIERRSCGQV